MPIRRTLAAWPLLALAGCLPAVPQPPAAPQPLLDPIAFFTGANEGRGTLSTITGKNQILHVRSLGIPADDGSLVLHQRIALSGEPLRERRWVIRPLGGGRYSGTLTEAVGPVEARAEGNTMTIAYDTKDYAVRQSLVLGADGTLHNRLDIMKWGLNVARLGETITRKAPPAE